MCVHLNVSSTRGSVTVQIVLRQEKMPLYFLRPRNIIFYDLTLVKTHELIHLVKKTHTYLKQSQAFISFANIPNHF